jgi:hypothetical protein
MKQDKVKEAIDRAIKTGERVELKDETGKVIGVISAPNEPLPPGWCCEEHAKDLSAKLAAVEGERDRLLSLISDWSGPKKVQGGVDHGTDWHELSISPVAHPEDVANALADSFDDRWCEELVFSLSKKGRRHWSAPEARHSTHILKRGRSLCGDPPGPPFDWPYGHVWCGPAEAKENATCVACINSLNSLMMGDKNG